MADPYAPYGSGETVTPYTGPGSANAPNAGVTDPAALLREIERSNRAAGSAPNITVNGTPESNSYLRLQNLLASYGLGGAGMMQWLWEQITRGTPDDLVFTEIRKRPEYIMRFPGMKEMQDAGLPAITEGEYLRIETQYKAVLRQAGADPSKYSSPMALKGFFKNNISPDELQERAKVWQTIKQAPETTARMRQMFKAHAKLDNIKDEDLFGMLLGSDLRLGRDYQQRTGVPLNLATVQDAMRKALAQEVASFRGGGGETKRDQEGKAESYFSAQQETF